MQVNVIQVYNFYDSIICDGQRVRRLRRTQLSVQRLHNNSLSCGRIALAVTPSRSLNKSYQRQLPKIQPRKEGQIKNLIREGREIRETREMRDMREIKEMREMREKREMRETGARAEYFGSQKSHRTSNQQNSKKYRRSLLSNKNQNTLSKSSQKAQKKLKQNKDSDSYSYSYEQNQKRQSMFSQKSQKSSARNSKNLKLQQKKNKQGQFSRISSDYSSNNQNKMLSSKSKNNQKSNEYELNRNSKKFSMKNQQVSGEKIKNQSKEIQINKEIKKSPERVISSLNSLSLKQQNDHVKTPSKGEQSAHFLLNSEAGDNVEYYQKAETTKKHSLLKNSLAKASTIKKMNKNSQIHNSSKKYSNVEQSQKQGSDVKKSFNQSHNLSLSGSHSNQKSANSFARHKSKKDSILLHNEEKDQIFSRNISNVSDHRSFSKVTLRDYQQQIMQSKGNKESWNQAMDTFTRHNQNRKTDEFIQPNLLKRIISDQKNVGDSSKKLQLRLDSIHRSNTDFNPIQNNAKNSGKGNNRASVSSLAKPEANTFEAVLENLQIHHFFISMLNDFKQKTQQLREGAPDTQILCFLLDRKHFYEIANISKALKGGKNIFSLTEFQIPNILLRKYISTPQIIVQATQIETESKQLFKKLEQTYKEQKPKLKNNKYFKLETPNDNFSKQIIRILQNELLENLQKMKTNVDVDLQQQLQNRIKQTMEIVFLFSELQGRNIKRMEFAEEIVDYDKYFEENQQLLMDTFQYFKELPS